MSQSEKQTAGPKLQHTLQYLWDMDIHYDYIHQINAHMGLCATRNKMIRMFHYNDTYIKVHCSEQRNVGHKTVTLH